MGKRGKTNSGMPRGNKTYWQSSDLNQRWQQFFRTQLFQLMLSRFRWVNLPKTCDARYLETQLGFHGIATIAHPKDNPCLFLSLRALPEGVNMYGNAPRWRAQGENGTDFSCDNSNGVVIYDNMMRANMAGAFTLLAYDMADIVRTKQVNRMHVKTPVVFVVDQAYRQQAINIFKQTAGNEPGIIATRGFKDNIDATAIQTGVQFMGRELHEDLMNSWNMAFTFLGIENLPFKAARQTATEIRDTGEATDLLSLNPLMCRRQACEEFNDRNFYRLWGKNTVTKPLDVVWNEDIESDSWNLIHNMEKMLAADEGGEGI